MDIQAVMRELESLGSEQVKKIYKNHGAKEPLFGVLTGAMKPLAKKIQKDYGLSMALYATGNYDAAYFAGIIADPKQMQPEDFENWMKTAYCSMMSDHVVAANLAETDYAQEVADRWIATGKELYLSAGWCCYCQLLCSRPDEWFEKGKLQAMLRQVAETIHSQPNRAKYAMNEFVIAVGIYYLPLHEEAVKTARRIGKVSVDHGNTNCKTPVALDAIRKAERAGKLGYKRKNRRL